MKKIILLIAILNFTICGFSQNILQHKIVIKSDSGYSIVNIYRGKVKSTHVDRTYFWYYKDAIHYSEGGVFESPLHGEYCFYSLQNNIIHNGHYNKGLKVGIWKHWAPNGLLSEITCWKNGLLHGAQKYYDNKGAIAKIDYYKKGGYIKTLFPKQKRIKKDKKTKEKKEKKQKTIKKIETKKEAQPSSSKKSIIDRFRTLFSKKKMKNEN